MLRDIPRYETLREMAKRVPEIDPDAVESYLVTLKVSSDIFDALSAHFSRHGISRGRFMVLMSLFREPDKPLSPAELADIIGVSRATITGLLDGLEREGYVKRQQSGTDRRMIIVALTPKGTAFLGKMLPDHFRRVADLMGGLSRKEQKMLSLLLNKVSERIPALRNPKNK